MSTCIPPSLPQQQSPEQRTARQFQLSLARTEYNYMHSYLESVPLSADLPAAEKFSVDYEAQVLAVFLPLAENFKQVVLRLLRRELEGDLPDAALQRVKEAAERLEQEFSLLHPGRDLADLRALLQAVGDLPEALKGLLRLPADLEKMARGLTEVFDDFAANGPTAFLKSTLFDMLSADHGRNYLQARSAQDFEALFQTLPRPQMLDLPRQDWMPAGPELPCEQDWYFGYSQTAGFNTTLLRGVALAPPAGSLQLSLSELQAKCPISDALLQSVLGRRDVSLRQAVDERRLYVCDFAMLDGAKADALHGEQRYLAAPIAVFYWNAKAPAGFPPQPEGVMQPVAIQLAQRFDAEASPIFTPNDCADAGDPNGLKWRLAKHIVQVVAAIHHESIAHLGDCHLVIEPIAVAAHRQLAVEHPILQLLIPHLRFTININDSAIHSLIAPGGVVATNVGPALESTLAMLAQSRRDWRWDERNPDRWFALRGVEALPRFAFRDDCLLLWAAIQRFVSGYLRLYYRDDLDVQQDGELQAWVAELVDPRYSGFQGLGGLSPSGDAARPWRLDSLDYLIELVAQILYTAGPQHAAVNYAQYPLMSYMPSVAGTLYQAPPTRSTVLQQAEDLLPWYPPLDVGLYTLSFEYLLSGVQYDRFGQYESNPRAPYFQDPRVQLLVADLQDELALAEIEIRRRNRSRPMAYEFQLPSRIPNSVSI